MAAPSRDLSAMLKAYTLQWAPVIRRRAGHAIIQLFSADVLAYLYRLIKERACQTGRHTGATYHLADPRTTGHIGGGEGAETD